MIDSVILPVAGKGTRLMPMTQVLPKPLFPLVTAGGRVVCVLHILLEQIHSAAIERVALIVSPGQQTLIERYLTGLETAARDRLPRHIQFIEQTEARGFGDAVWLGREFVGQKPFVILLGDHLHVSPPGTDTCLTQVAQAFARFSGDAMIGVHSVGRDEVHKVGLVKGELMEEPVYRCADFVEKPSPEIARQRLTTPGMKPDTFLGHCGIYVFSPLIFKFLEQEQSRCRGGTGEVELAAAQSRLLQADPANYFLCRIRGSAYDMGTVTGYQNTFRAYGWGPGDG
jgi:UTP--glucose-1-phosphate uridylyltransferase